MKTTSMQIKSMWKHAMTLPCDGKVRVLPEVGLEAVHTPNCARHIEQIVIRDGDVCHRRLFSHGRWSAPHTVSGGAWSMVTGYGRNE